MVRKALAAAIVASFALLAASCGTSPTGSQTVASAEDSASTPDGAAALAAARQQHRPHVLWFWSAYCTDCQADAAAVATAARTFGDGVPIIGVPSPQDSPEDRQAFIDRLEAPIPQIVDGSLDLWVENRVAATPTMIYVDADGNTKLETGPIFSKTFTDRLQRLLDDPSALS